MAKPKFAKTLYLTKDNVGSEEEEYYLAWDTPDASECDGDIVGVYELVGVRKLCLDSSLVECSKKEYK